MCHAKVSRSVRLRLRRDGKAYTYREVNQLTLSQTPVDRLPRGFPELFGPLVHRAIDLPGKEQLFLYFDNTHVNLIVDHV